MYEMLERNKSSNIVRHNVRHWPPKDNLEIGLTLEWYFVVDFEVVFWFYLCLYFLFSITWIIWSRYSKTLIHKVHLTNLLVHINHLTMINLKVMNIRYPLIRNPRTGSTQPVDPLWSMDHRCDIHVHVILQKLDRKPKKSYLTLTNSFKNTFNALDIIQEQSKKSKSQMPSRFCVTFKAPASLWHVTVSL